MATFVTAEDILYRPQTPYLPEGLDNSVAPDDVLREGRFDNHLSRTGVERSALLCHGVRSAFQLHAVHQLHQEERRVPSEGRMD